MSDKMMYDGREIVLEDQWDDVESFCEGCVLEHVSRCTQSVNPPQKHNVCVDGKQLLVFKYKEDVE